MGACAIYRPFASSLSVDAAAVAALYTEDAVILPPGGEMMKGRRAIQVFWKGAAEQLGDGKLTTVDVKPLGSEAVREIGTFTFRTKGAQPQEITGKYVVVWEKVGSDWKLATDIWNTNKQAVAYSLLSSHRKPSGGSCA
ncbi:DUF4440 domain-containing protein [Microvirga sp. VF16]|uniref:YybH family protein n=1 Tax=Microvirga sp. VF16 TaxID=2807101 RepID=UPI001FEF1857|nr:DUF4440 domain-containing protein [Microvirga sp. VF16]